MSPAEGAELLEFYLTTCDVLWRRLDVVPHVVAGRLAALAQGLHVRPTRVDLRIAEADVGTASLAFSTLRMPRWNDRIRMYVGDNPDLASPGPLRWYAADLTEMRVDIVPTMSTALTVTVGERQLSVVPLAELFDTAPDVAELHRRERDAARQVSDGQSME